MAEQERPIETGRPLTVGGRKPRSFLRSRIARLIFASNLAGLIILVVGALFVNEIRAGLVRARMESLQAQALSYEGIISNLATAGDPQPYMNGPIARQLLKNLEAPKDTRVRIFDPDGEVIADSFLLADRVSGKELEPLRQPDFGQRAIVGLSRSVGAFFDGIGSGAVDFIEARSMDEELDVAQGGDVSASQRFSEWGERVISVSVPIRHVSATVGVLTVEASDLQDIIRAERAALAPIIGVAILVSLITSALLTIGIARPLRRLSIAADRVRTGVSQRLDMPMLTRRRDEIGDLGQALEDMTAALHDRIELNERFAADVAHELKNPLTSIRSAVETMQTVDKPELQARMQQIIAKDVIRLDRLITDISNASRLEAEISRERPQPLDLRRLLEDLSAIWHDTRRDGEPDVRLEAMGAKDALFIIGREGPISQVIRNLVENARSFSPADGEVLIRAWREDGVVRISIEDDGPGIPPDKLEKVFERFYSDRPKGAKFGNNSGLGLSIVKQIIETHRGEVFAENRMREGVVQGARFVIRLPAAQSNLKTPT